MLNKGRKERSVLSVLAYCHFQLGDFKQASGYYQELASLCPDIVEYSYYWAQALLKSGQYEEAI